MKNVNVKLRWYSPFVFTCVKKCTYISGQAPLSVNFNRILNKYNIKKILGHVSKREGGLLRGKKSHYRMTFTIKLL